MSNFCPEHLPSVGLAYFPLRRDGRFLIEIAYAVCLYWRTPLFSNFDRVLLWMVASPSCATE